MADITNFRVFLRYFHGNWSQFFLLFGYEGYAARFFPLPSILRNQVRNHWNQEIKLEITWFRNLVRFQTRGGPLGYNPNSHQIG